MSAARIVNRHQTPWILTIGIYYPAHIKLYPHCSPTVSRPCNGAQSSNLLRVYGRNFSLETHALVASKLCGRAIASEDKNIPTAPLPQTIVTAPVSSAGAWVSTSPFRSIRAQRLRVGSASGQIVDEVHTPALHHCALCRRRKYGGLSAVQRPCTTKTRRASNFGDHSAPRPSERIGRLHLACCGK